MTIFSSPSSSSGSSRKNIKMATVEFDVGGTIYKVSKSLLEMYPDTMLASLASPRWTDETEDGESKPIFIERNGERFQYVLDYMRDNGKVNLPASVSRSAVIDDLEYFGFENVKTTGEFHVSYPSSVAAITNLKEAKNYFNEKSTTFTRKYQCMELAKRCFEMMCRNTDMEGQLTLPDTDPLYLGAGEIANNSSPWREEFDSILEPVGMKLQEAKFSGGYYPDSNSYFSFSFVESSS